jgi:pSer/pThr/pTyr-binding forkhead associated (FHA) protein
MECGVCGGANDDDARYCVRCGAALEATTEVIPGPVERPLGMSQPRVGLPALHVISGPLAGSVCVLNETVTTIGRDPSSDLFLDDITVSRRHAEIVRSRDGFKIRDLGSVNGTYINGIRQEETHLRDGAHLRIGRYDVLFRD